jgi:alanine racemase
MPPAQAHVNLAAFAHNYRVIRQFAPEQKIMPVLKDNAYGHGSVQVAKALPAADAFCVAFTAEALPLRSAGISQPITVLQGPHTAEELAMANDLRLDFVIHKLEQVVLLENQTCKRPVVVWLKLNTGMNRLGFPAALCAEIYQRLSAIVSVAEIRFFSHLACADETGNGFTQQQADLLDQSIVDSTAPVSLANSAGIMAWPNTHRNWVRPGIMLYGASPFSDWRERDSGLKPAMTLKTSVISLQDVMPGDRVGYGGTWVAEKAGQIAIAAIGYGDGYPRCLPSGTPVLVKGVLAPMVGRVSMDMINIDVSHVPAVQIGDEVILWGEQLPVEEIAELANTISYELFCGINARVHRIYS